MHFFQLRDRVTGWLESISETDVDVDDNYTDKKSPEPCTRQTMPDTPPATILSSGSEAPLPLIEPMDDLTLQAASPDQQDESPSKKRRLPGQAEDNEQTPRRTHDRPILRPPPTKSPTKRLRSPTRIASVADLCHLEKPVFLTTSNRSQTLPSDVRSLYTAIKRISMFMEFLPAEIQDEVTAVLQKDEEEEVQQHWFAPSSAADTNKKEKLLDEMVQLMVIKQKAEESARRRRHEAAWNSVVHQPLLEVAFEDHVARARELLDTTGKTVDETAGAGSTANTRVRIENISSATICGDCVPHLQKPLNDDAASVGAWSLSHNSTWTTSTSSEGSMDEEDPFVSRLPLNSTAHSKAGSKKVDFAVVLESDPGSALHTAVETVLGRLRMMPSLTCSVNPSGYGPLLDSPMAIAIETKSITAARDPLVHLGMVAAAVHRRLYTLPVHRATGSKPLTERGILITLPLISVVDHRWELYFACDRGDKIELVGPLDLGSTMSLVSIYRLLVSLRLLKVWTKEVFLFNLMQWLN